MSGKQRVRHRPNQIVEKLQEADRLLNAGQSLGQVLQTLGSLILGTVLGALAALVGLTLARIRVWPVLAQVLDWTRVEELAHQSSDKTK